jgi:hypothetical protein
MLSKLADRENPILDKSESQDTLRRGWLRGRFHRWWNRWEAAEIFLAKGRMAELLLRRATIMSEGTITDEADPDVDLDANMFLYDPGEC